MLSKDSARRKILAKMAGHFVVVSRTSTKRELQAFAGKLLTMVNELKESDNV